MYWNKKFLQYLFRKFIITIIIVDYIFNNNCCIVTIIVLLLYDESSLTSIKFNLFNKYANTEMMIRKINMSFESQIM